MNKRILISVMGWVMLIFLVSSCVHDPLVTPVNPGETPEPGCTNSETVCFESNVLPIFVSSCAKPHCHDALSHKEGFILDTYSNIVRKGIEPGNANGSRLYNVLFGGGEDRMPPSPYVQLTLAQKDSIKIWINQGARNTVDCNCYCDENQFTYSSTIQSLLFRNCVGCHNPNSLNGNVNLSTYTATKVEVNNGKLLGSVTHTTGYIPMPSSGKLSDCEILQITNWINAGSLNN